jgi:hypothetical protein
VQAISRTPQSPVIAPILSQEDNEAMFKRIKNCGREPRAGSRES